MTTARITPTARRRIVVTVTPAGKAWVLRLSDGVRSTPFPRKDDAIAEGRNWCLAEYRQGGLAQLRIKGRDGRIQEERTYGADPRRFKG